MVGGRTVMVGGRTVMVGGRTVMVEGRSVVVEGFDLIGAHVSCSGSLLGGAGEWTSHCQGSAVAHWSSP